MVTAKFAPVHDTITQHSLTHKDIAMRTYLPLLLAAAGLAGVAACTDIGADPVSAGSKTAGKAAETVQATTTTLGRFKVIADNDTTFVYTTETGQDVWAATYTANCRTVIMTGEERAFTEGGITIRHSTYVRLLDAPFNGTVDTTWLATNLAENTVAFANDVLATSMEYLDGRAGNANYGPDATTEGSDFHDYLQINWVYTPHYSTSLKKNVSSWTNTYETNRANCVDCSGYMRLVFGYRHDMPMCYNVDPAQTTARMPRKSYDIYDNAPGRKIVSGHVWNGANADANLERIHVGDLVFFDADTSTTTEKGRIDHVGMYIGNDNNGNMRFIHSRKSNNVGPTFTGDANGKSILNNDGTGQYLYYVRAFRGTRRL